jgi:DNA-binding NarL/FixJ family response regulator
MVEAGVVVVVCDSHPLTRAGIRTTLSQESDIEVTADVPNWSDAFRLVQCRCSALMVIEECLFVEALHARGPHLLSTRVVVSGSDDLGVDRCLCLVRGGVQGIVLRSGPPNDLVRAVRAVARGDGFLSPEFVVLLLAALRGGRSGRLQLPEQYVADLTARERDVLALVSRGMTNRQIATALLITEKTVKFHVSNLLAKLHSRTRGELIANLASFSLGGPPAPDERARRAT